MPGFSGSARHGRRATEYGQDGAGVRALGVEGLVTLLLPFVVDHDDVRARRLDHCHEVATQHDSELVLAWQPERLRVNTGPCGKSPALLLQTSVHTGTDKQRIQAYTG
jgi:hypothetical protein